MKVIALTIYAQEKPEKYIKSFTGYFRVTGLKPMFTFFFKYISYTGWWEGSTLSLIYQSKPVCAIRKVKSFQKH